MANFNSCKQQLNKLSARVAEALVNFSAGNKSVTDRIALRATLLQIVSELPSHSEYEGEWLPLTDDNKITICELIDEQIPLQGEIPSHIVSRYSSGSIGFQILCDSYDPSQF